MIKDLKIDLKVVEDHFMQAVVSVADEKIVRITDVSLIICITQGTGVFNKGKEVVRAIKFSKSGAFDEETVKIKSLTKADLTGAISGALKEVLKGEIELHNTSLDLDNDHPHKRASNIKYPHKIDKEIELWISVDKNDKLQMSMIYNSTFLRKYSIQEEFSEIQNSKIGEVVNEDEIGDAQVELRSEK